MTMQDAMAFLQSESPPRDVEELLIVNNRQAANYASANLYRTVDEQYLKELVYYLTEGMDDGGDSYRATEWVDYSSVDDEEFIFPAPQSIPDKVRELTDFLSDTKTHPLIKAAVAQAWMMIVRPFPEGNERLGRLISSVILLRAGYSFFADISLSALIARKSYGYYESIVNILTEEHDGDLTYFVLLKSIVIIVLTHPICTNKLRRLRRLPDLQKTGG